MKWLRTMNTWNRVPADHKLAEDLSRNKHFQKVIVGVLNLPKRIADYLVPDEDLQPKKQISGKSENKKSSNK